MKKLIFCSIILISTSVIFAQDKTAAERFTDNVRFENAEKLYEIKQFDRALQLYGEYIEIFPDGMHRNEVLNRIAEIYFSRYDYQKAIKYYNILREENNNTDTGLTAYYKIGLCMLKMGKNDQANQIFKDIVMNNPSSPVAVKAKLQLDINKMIVE